jgi:hypothetical protein
MPRTKEQFQKILDDNYRQVQETELNVYDEHKKIEKDFTKKSKDFAKKLTTDLKTITAKEKEVVTLHKGVSVELEKQNASVKQSVETKKKEIEKIYQESLQAAEDKKTGSNSKN